MIQGHSRLELIRGLNVFHQRLHQLDPWIHHPVGCSAVGSRAQLVETRFRGSISRTRALIHLCEDLLELVRSLIEGLAKSLFYDPRLMPKSLIHNGLESRWIHGGIHLSITLNRGFVTHLFGRSRANMGVDGDSRFCKILSASETSR